MARKKEYVLLLTSYCNEDGCSDKTPCLECLKICNIVETTSLNIINKFGGWDFLTGKKIKNKQ